MCNICYVAEAMLCRTPSRKNILREVCTLVIILVLILLLFLPAKMGGNTHTHLLKQKRLVDFKEVA